MYGTKKAAQILKRGLTPSLCKKLYYYLIRQPEEERVAEFLRFLCLTGQRSVDYKFLVPEDIKILPKLKVIKICWDWGKTRERMCTQQYTYLPYSLTENGFFNILNCVRALKRLQPKDHVFLLRWNHASQSQILRTAFLNLPVALQPPTLSKITPYFFKSVLSAVLLQAEISPQLVCHYLKHSLSKRELQTMSHKLQYNFGGTSIKYAISMNQLPYLLRELTRYWNNVQM